MCSLLLATLLTSASPCAAPASSPPPVTRGKRMLDDSELNGLRGARRVAFRSGRGGLGRITQDSTMRDLAIGRNAMVQQFDNWFADVGQPLINANLLR